jgi:G3E family GTPase
MRTLLITGFLGSGKSTVLLSLAAYLRKKDGPRAVVIVENELGDISLASQCATPLGDGMPPGMSPLEMTNDCICCTLTGELIGLLQDIQSNLNPSWLLIEASSLTHQSIKDTIHQTLNTFEPISILVINAETWAEMYKEVPMLVGTQAQRADYILINKIDHVTRETLDTVKSDIRKLNPERPLRLIRGLSDNLEDFWADLVAEVDGESMKLAQM